MLLDGWEEEWEGADSLMKRKIPFVSAAVVIRFCGGLRGEEVFLSSLKWMLNLWEYTRLRKVQPHIMVNFQGRFKG